MIDPRLCVQCRQPLTGAVPAAQVCSQACHKATELEVRRLNRRLARLEDEADRLREALRIGAVTPALYSVPPREQLESLDHRIMTAKEQQRALLGALAEDPQEMNHGRRQSDPRILA